jgi:hypothetical protein
MNRFNEDLRIDDDPRERRIESLSTFRLNAILDDVR